MSKVKTAVKTTKWGYVLKSIKGDMTAYNGFKYPTKGEVVAPDFNTTKACGNGLHGLLWAEGNGTLLNWDEKAVWLVIKTDLDKIVVIDNEKVKFEKGFVEYCGDCDGALDFIKKKMPDDILDRVYTGNNISGIKGSASATGTKGSASATGYEGSASATGYEGSASATGVYGSASATGTKGSASATGYEGSASATGDGTIILSWFDDKAKRYRLVIGYPGENGLKEKTFYTLDENHNFKEVVK